MAGNRSSDRSQCGPGRLRILAGGTLLVFLWVVQAGSVHAQFRELVKRLPGTANAVVILNVEKAFTSPLGVQEGWEENLEKAFEAGLVRVPPQATRFVLAAQMDFEFLEPIWEVAVADFSQEPDLEKIAKERSGTLDTVAGVPAVALPNDTYLLRFGPKTLGAMAPANRQAVLRWVRELQGRLGPGLSPYLREAAGYSDEAGTEIIMAIDLEGLFSTERVSGYLKAKEIPSQVDQGELARVLSSVEGVRVGIRIGEKPFGKVAVDFGQSAAIPADLAKSLLLGVLAGAGARIEELEQWKAKVSGTVVSLEGYLSKDGLRRALSIVESPAPPHAVTAQAEEGVSPGDSEATTASKTLDYFRAVTAMFGDLKNDKRDLKTLSQSSLYYDKYARRIERLPILHVDSEMLDYGAFVAQTLRQASGAVRTMGIRGGVRQSQIISADTAPYAYGGYRYGRYGWYGGYGGAGGYAVYSPRMEARNIAAQRRVVRSQERGVMAANVWQLRDQVIAATNEIRRKMTEKYQVEF